MCTKHQESAEDEQTEATEDDLYGTARFLHPVLDHLRWILTCPLGLVPAACLTDDAADQTEATEGDHTETDGGIGGDEAQADHAQAEATEDGVSGAADARFFVAGHTWFTSLRCSIIDVTGTAACATSVTGSN